MSGSIKPVAGAGRAFNFPRIQRARNAGILFVAAAGNDGSGSVSYPAAYNGVIAVGAIDSGNNKADFSNYGSKLDLVAPGVSVYSTYPGNRYQGMSGTSMATPHNAGLMALMLDANPTLSPAQVDQILEQTALDLGASGKENTHGSGRIRAYEAVQAAISVGIESGSGVVRGSSCRRSTLSPPRASRERGVRPADGARLAPPGGRATFEAPTFRPPVRTDSRA